MFKESLLIKKAKTDPNAFTKLYRLHMAGTYRYLFLRSKNKAIAEDLTSQVWEIILQKIPQLTSNHPGAFKIWLFTITRNVLYQHYRTNAKTQISSLEDNNDLLIDAGKIPSELNQEKEEQRQIRVLIESLPKKQREIVWLKFLNGLKNKEIAKLLAIDERTVASNLSRALAFLKTNLKKLQ